MCNACPFAMTHESEFLQGLGCLPEPFEMIKRAKESNVALSCHENDKIACRGLCERIPEAAKMPVMGYSEWYKNG